ncbi:MAG: hypothetical protein M3333_02410, partial [Actinomycetota bacterium]|nr:hypothetical protein [Actinomycetota bacterium]
MTVRHHRLLVVGVALWVLVLPPPVRAGDLTPDQLRRLAARASGDRDALLRLRRADTVGGRKVDLSTLLSGVRGDALAARLDALADGAGAPTVHVDPRRARDAARRIL